MADTTRVELKDGQWLDIKTRTNLGDLEFIENRKLERDGKTTPLLDSIDILERLIVGWSFDGPVTREHLRERLDLAALMEVSGTIAKAARPNASGPSSSGGRRRAGTAVGQ